MSPNHVGISLAAGVSKEFASPSEPPVSIVERTLHDLHCVKNKMPSRLPGLILMMFNWNSQTMYLAQATPLIVSAEAYPDAQEEHPFNLSCRAYCARVASISTNILLAIEEDTFSSKKIYSLIPMIACVRFMDVLG